MTRSTRTTDSPGSATELRRHLVVLNAERAAAELGGLGSNREYIDDLDNEITAEASRLRRHGCHRDRDPPRRAVGPAERLTIYEGTANFCRTGDRYEPVLDLPISLRLQALRVDY